MGHNYRDEKEWAQFEKDFKGKTFHRPSDDYQVEVGTKSNVATEGKDSTDASRYNAAAYGYGLSTWPERARPKSIYFAESLEHVVQAVKEAYEANLAIAVRTGGHHYGCASSTTGENIVLDVKFAFRSMDFDKETGIATVGVSNELIDMVKWLQTIERKDGAVGAFVPHGECGTVNIGGHSQSGGYSPYCGRSFGYLVDHIVGFKIVVAPTAPGLEPEVLDIVQPVAGQTDQRNDDLFWAVRGGAPGGFGVVCEVKIKVLWDADYPYSRAKFWAAKYTKENMSRFLTVCHNFAANKNWPNDYNIWAGTIAGNSVFVDQNTSIDQKISNYHPELNPEVEPTSRIIVVSATYTNLSGANRSDEEAEDAERFFEFIDNQIGGLKDLFQLAAANFFRVILDPSLLGFMLPMSELLFPGKYVPLSKGAYVTTNLGLARLQNNPYVMGTYMTPINTLTSGDPNDPFTQWNVDMCDEAGQIDGVWPDYQWLIMGGKMTEPRPDNAVPHRGEQYMIFLYNHYDIVQHKKDVTEPGIRAKEHMGRIKDALLGTDGTNGYLKANDQMVAFPNGESVLDDHWQAFFGDEALYRKILKIKRTYDPTDVFTPNTWMVGATRKFGIAKAGTPSEIALLPVEQL